jgi:hypothetical protein
MSPLRIIRFRVSAKGRAVEANSAYSKNAKLSSPLFSGSLVAQLPDKTSPREISCFMENSAGK